MTKAKQSFGIRMLVIVFMTGLSAILLLQIKTRAARLRTEAMLLEKKAAAISCDPRQDFQRGKEKPLQKKSHDPLDKHDGNGCPHQLVAGFVFLSDKRKTGKRFSCSQNNC